MLDELAARCREIERHDALRAVVLSGEGKAFSAGGDIEAWSAESPERVRTALDPRRACDLRRLGEAAPTCHWRSGRAHSWRRAGACRLRGHSHRGGASEDRSAGIKALALFPGWSGTQRAVRRFGAQAVRRMALFGKVFAAEEALNLGIVDQVVLLEKVPAAAVELAQGRRPGPRPRGDGTR